MLKKILNPMNRTSQRVFSRPFLPSYHQNAVVHLILATGVCFIAFFFTAVCFQAFGRYQYPAAVGEILNYLALPPLGAYPAKAWTLLTYGLFHTGFMNWLGSAIWIYVWGSVLQMLTGYRQVIPTFIAGTILGGVVALLLQFIPGVAAPAYLVGAGAGVMALAAATFMFAPNYRFWITPTFSLSIKLVLVIFILLNFMGAVPGVAGIGWLAGGALAGVLSVVLLRKGYRIGDRMYSIFESAGGRETAAGMSHPAGRRESVLHRNDKNKGTRVLRPQERVDALLEKIHAKGYASLSQEERDFLKNAGGNI